MVDSANHTGYAQVLEEWDVTTGSDLARSYVIGHDVIAQADSPTTVYYLLKDGHGSTRLLVDDLRVWKDGYNYDAYGNLIGHSGTPLTDILYSGEMTDATGLQYLRDRYYDPNTGRFNRLDSFAGNTSDPLSLHKYIYCHSSPIMYSDPTGMFFLASNLIYGREVHMALGRHFMSSVPGGLSDASINRILGTRVWALGSMRPDLTDVAGTGVYEIKPAGAQAAGAAQLATYLFTLNTFDPQKRLWTPGLMYIPPSVVPLNSHAIATVSPSIGGVITYTVIDMVEVTAWVLTAAAIQLRADLTVASLIQSLVPIPI